MMFEWLTGLFWIRVFPVLALALLAAVATHAAPRTPTQDAEVLEKLPTRAGDSVSRELSRLRAQVAKAPTDSALATELAQRYFDLALARGDPRYVGYAEAVVARFTTRMSAPLLTLRGVLRQYRHDFEGGLKDFQAALALDPDYAIAHAWRGAIFLVQADYAAVVADGEGGADRARARSPGLDHGDQLAAVTGGDPCGRGLENFEVDAVHGIEYTGAPRVERAVDNE